MRSVDDLPVAAAAVLEGIAFREGLSPEAVLNARTLHQRTVRHAVWLQIAHLTGPSGERRAYTDADIAGWFGVTRPAVSIALARLEDGDDPIPARRSTPRKSGALELP